MRLIAMTARLPSYVRSLLPAMALVLLTGLAYWPAVRHGGFIWDDAANVAGNPLLRSPSGLGDIWTKVGPGEGGTVQYYPLTYTSFWLEYRLWGLNPAGYHLTNVLLHGLNAVLVWLILLRLRVPGALLAASLFALHPVNAESVAWITERKNVLSGFFYFLSLLSFIRFFGLEGPREDGGPVPGSGGRRSYYLGLFFFVCALASKTATAVLPAVVLLLLWWKTGRTGRRDALLCLPLFLVALLAGLVTVYVEKYPGGTMGGEWTLSAAEHILLAGRILWFYAGKLLWPFPLVFIYPRWAIDPSDWRQYLFPLGAAAVIAALWLVRKRTGRGPMTAALYFAGTLAPVLGFVHVQYMLLSYVADHFQYLAGLGPLVLAAVGASLAWRRYEAGRAAPAYAVAGALLLVLGALTWRQSGIYASDERIWSDTIRKNPGAWLAHNNLGILLAGRGKYEEAIAHYREAVRLKPDYPDAHSNWGLDLAALGRNEEAVLHYREALRLKPDHYWTRNNWGRLLADLGRWEEAMAQYRLSLRARPDAPETHNDLGVALSELGRTEEAIAHYREALRLRPDYAEALHNLKMDLAARGAPEPLK